MTIAPTDFIGDFPEFSGVPTPGIQFYLDFGYNLLNPLRWPQTASPNSHRSLLDLGIELFTAHNLAVERDAQQEAARGGMPGRIRGPVTSEAGGGISASYATVNALYDDAGFWNMTSYGTRFYMLLRLVGAGPIQVNIGVIPPFTGGVGAWPGPWGGYLIGQSW